MRPSPSSKPLRLAGACLALVASNVLLFALYRLLFVAWFAHAAAAELPVVLIRGLRLDAAVLGLEILAPGAVALLTRYARGPMLVGALWTVTYLNFLTLVINLLFFHERNQHLWEMFFANLAEPRDIWVATAPFLYQHPVLVLGLLLLTVGMFVVALRHALAVAGQRYDLWRSPGTV